MPSLKLLPLLVTSASRAGFGGRRTPSRPSPGPAGPGTPARRLTGSRSRPSQGAGGPSPPIGAGHSSDAMGPLTVAFPLPSQPGVDHARFAAAAGADENQETPARPAL